MPALRTASSSSTVSTRAPEYPLAIAFARSNHRGAHDVVGIGLAHPARMAPQEPAAGAPRPDRPESTPRRSGRSRCSRRRCARPGGRREARASDASGRPRSRRARRSFGRPRRRQTSSTVRSSPVRRSGLVTDNESIRTTRARTPNDRREAQPAAERRVAAICSARSLVGACPVSAIRNASRSIASSRVGETARTDAVLGTSCRRAISPKPSPRSSTLTRVPSRSTSTVPSAIAKYRSPMSPSLMITSPVETSTSVAPWATPSSAGTGSARKIPSDGAARSSRRARRPPHRPREAAEAG